MKQLFYTSCEAGKSFGGAEGFQIRAASSGIGSERMRAVLPYTGYKLPAHAHPLELGSQPSPVRLAFLKTPEVGPILCHSVSAGVDPTTRRPGNFFSHVLLDVPPTFTAEAAIASWQSDSWRRTDGPFDATLPDIDDIHAKGSLTDEALRQFLASEHGQRIFRFVLAALLTTGVDHRIFVAAPSEDVALCVYGLTRVLPNSCLGTLTFSTYESDPLSCRARVIGTLEADGGEVDMPSSCYSGKAVGYNSRTGRASQVTPECEFVEYATAAVTTGNREGLEQLRNVCDQSHIDRPELLNLACRAECGSELTKNDLLRLAPYPRFLSHLLGKSSIQRSLLDRFAEDQELAGVVATKVAPMLKENSEAIRAFRENAKQAAKDAIVQGKLPSTRMLLEHILPATADAPMASAAIAVLDDIADPRAVPWDIRAYLLTQMARMAPSGLPASARARWLAVSSAELPLLCDLSIPGGWKTQACLTCLRHAGVSRPLVDALITHFELLLDVLCHLPGDTEAARDVSMLAAALLARSSAPARLLGDVVRHRRQLSPEITSAFLTAAAKSDTFDVFFLASQCGPGLLDVLDGGDGLDTFLARLLDFPPEMLLSDRQVLALFRAAMPKTPPGEIRDGLESILAVPAFVERPTLDDERLARVATALGTLRGAAIGNMVLQAAVAAMLSINDDSPGIAVKLESLLRNLGPFASGGTGGLYQRLLDEFRSRKEFWKRQHLICAMVGIGLGATKSADLAQQAVVTAELARDLAEEVAKRSKRRVFTSIERQSRTWPHEARLRWDLFAKYVRPRGLLSRVAGTWKKAIAVPIVFLCLAVGASRLSCRGGAAGTNFANGPIAEPPTKPADIASPYPEGKRPAEGDLRSAVSAGSETRAEQVATRAKPGRSETRAEPATRAEQGLTPPALRTRGEVGEVIPAGVARTTNPLVQEVGHDRPQP